MTESNQDDRGPETNSAEIADELASLREQIDAIDPIHDHVGPIDRIHRGDREATGSNRMHDSRFGLSDRAGANPAKHPTITIFVDVG